MKLAVTVALVALLGEMSCRAKGLRAGASTCASIEVLHPGVRVLGAGSVVDPQGIARAERSGSVRTAAEGRAIVRTDDGIELRLAGDTELTFLDGRARVVRGRVSASAWGEGERALSVGDDAVLRFADAAFSVERGVAGVAGTRVVVVRGEASYQQGARQGQVAQGESLEGTGALELHPAGVWDDWTGGAATPQTAHASTGRMVSHGDDGEAPGALALNEQRVVVRVTGDLAITTVTQRFFNGGERVAPVEYRVRVPDGALVSSFRVGEGEGDGWNDAVPGVVARRVAHAGLAALLSAGDGEVYASLGTLAPGATRRTELSWVQWLPHTHNRRSWVYPLGDAVAPQAVGEFSLDVDLSKADAARVESPEGARLDADQHVRMRRSDWRPRGALVVTLDDARPRTIPAARAWRSVAAQPDGTRHLLVDVALPTPIARGTDLALVLDTSAATDPASLELARASIDAMLRQLGPDDRAALFVGDLGARPAGPSLGTLAAVDDARRESMLDAVARARSGGATDLARMLVDAHAALDPSRNGAVVYLGDGTPTVGALDPARLVDEATRQAPDLRLYTVTLGAAAHPEVLAPLTEDGGLALRVDDADDAVHAAERIVAHALRPCLRDLRVDAGPLLTHPMPTRRTVWVAGDALHLLAELPGRAPTQLTVRARDGLTARAWTLPLELRDVVDHGDLARRWASARIDALTRGGAGRGSIADLGARFGVITPVSGLVVAAVDPTVAAQGLTVRASLWPAEDDGARLPSLGVSSDLAPRGVLRTERDAREVPVAFDDGRGWQVHGEGEGRGVGGAAALVEALSVAGPAAEVCITRRRALRPAIAGTVGIAADIDATGQVTAATLAYSTLNDVEAAECVRRAVSGVRVPEPALFGASPGRYVRAFTWSLPIATGPATRVCAPTAGLSRDVLRTLWRERLRVRGPSASTALDVWNTAVARCELRTWDDRRALLDVLLVALTNPDDVVALRNGLSDRASVMWLDGAIARRFGPTWVWRARGARPVSLDWDALLTRLAAPTLTPAQRIALLRAWLVAVPDDVDLRLRLMDALEDAGSLPEARAVGERLRHDPVADARVRSRVAAALLRANDRDEALRAFTEVAEFAPYDPFARARLSDLLLTWGWPAEAYHHAQTLAMLSPGDALPLVRVALCALAAGREDEGLRLLRRASEASGSDAMGPVAQAILDAEVARVVALRPDDPAVRAWLRVAARLRNAREGRVIVRWTHPDLALELLARTDADTAPTVVGDAPASLGARVWTPDTALVGQHLVVRATAGLEHRRAVDVRVQLLVPQGLRTRLVERTVRLDREHRARGLRVTDGALVDEPVTPDPAAVRTAARR